MPRMRDVGTREVQSELLRLNVRTRQFCGRDPDTKNVVSLFGLEMTQRERPLRGFSSRPAVALLCSHTAIKKTLVCPNCT